MDINEAPPLPEVPADPKKLKSHIDAFEKLEGPIKPDNQARIIWQNPEKPKRTRYALIYLHGFSASQGEGDPVHHSLARNTNSNLYLHRLTGHGLVNRQAIQPFDEEVWLQSVRHALAIGQKIGKKIILLGSSTGGTLALYLASRYPELIDGLLLYSPLIGFANERVQMLEGTYINKVARTLLRKLSLEKRRLPNDSLYDKYWYPSYRFDEVLALVRLIKTLMNSATFKKINQPLFLGYYYKSRHLQDTTVSVPAMLDMFKSIATPAKLKQKKAYPDAGSHVITSRYTTSEYAAVATDSLKFLNEVLPQM